MNVPQADIDYCLKVEFSVTESEKELFDDCMNGRSLSERIKSPLSDRDIRDGCILIGVFMACRKDKSLTPERESDLPIRSRKVKRLLTY